MRMLILTAVLGIFLALFALFRREQKRRCPACEGYGVAYVGPLGEAPHCTACGGGGQLKIPDFIPSSWTRTDGESGNRHAAR